MSAFEGIVRSGAAKFLLCKLTPNAARPGITARTVSASIILMAVRDERALDAAGEKRERVVGVATKAYDEAQMQRKRIWRSMVDVGFDLRWCGCKLLNPRMLECVRG